MSTPIPFSGLQQVPEGAVKTALRLLWERVQFISSIASPREGTLQPDTRPTNLGAKDTGLLFFSTDFNRIFQWTGSAWEDAPGSPPRYQISFYPAPPAPGAGWAPCNGSQVFVSTPTGATTYFTPPIVSNSNDLVAYIRL